MATCGTCQREIIWAWSEEDRPAELIAVDKLAAVGGVKTFSLDYGEGPNRPVAARVRRPDMYPGHRLHSETCGVGTLR